MDPSDESLGYCRRPEERLPADEERFVLLGMHKILVERGERDRLGRSSRRPADWFLRGGVRDQMVRLVPRGRAGRRDANQ